MAPKVIVVDDDPLVGDLTLYLLKDAGYDAELIQDSFQAIPAVREKRPDLVILDILMPGIDGLTLCHKIKTDPELKSMKVAIVSGKSFDADKQRAAQFGADSFIEKPYQVDNFAKQIAAILGNPSVAVAVEAAPTAAGPKGAFEVAVWGCSSQPPEGAANTRRTSCVSAEFSGHLFIFDAGTGLEALGSELKASGAHEKVWIFLTHFHEDHISGLAPFLSGRGSGRTVYISGANDPAKSLQDAVEERLAASKEPVAAEIQLYSLLEDSYEIMPGVKLTCFYANHPTTTLGYRLETQGRSLVYCPDSELYGETATALQDYDEKLGKLCADADLLIHDGRYTEADYETHKNQGHSSFANAAAFAARYGIKKVLLFHQDAAYDEAALEKMLADAKGIAAEKGAALEVELARDGVKLAL